ncbi:NmrA family transcriptional regulator [Actinophytocola xinjiangensis]|uniref:NmrA family transcriptional regulator n=1 Tax=Actinophytocola xinjiangensis TaxID=485602 RepID=A0A7Z0WQW3_9PSEU|nr:NAD(P)H-binding protein [Actinophytocola xinjiangensis]OLF12645.1 NmrA family transcriptional regulator [Actinophytocola xinjiangensis]
MILVTGTSGALGGLIHAGLSAVDGLDVTAASSRPGPAGRRVDFDDPRTLATGFAGVDVLVFVSAGFAEDDVVLARHGAVVDAAAAAGVRHVIYTSLAGSGEHTTLALAHRWTEARLAAAPFAVTVLRNGFYAELLAGLALAGAAGGGELTAALGTGRVSVVARADLADVAVRVAAEVGRDLDAGGRSAHAGRTYELEGVAALGGDDLAGLLSVGYRPVTLADARAALAGAPAYQVTHTLSLLANAAAGVLLAGDTDLTALLAAPPRPVRDLIATVFATGTRTPEPI